MGKEMFDGLDTDKDGLVRVSSLKPLMANLGISDQDLASWMTDLPPVLHRPQGGVASEFGLMTGLQRKLIRQKSKLDLDDMERLMAPVYLPPHPRPRAAML